jgi:hypothetical protein
MKIMKMILLSCLCVFSLTGFAQQKTLDIAGIHQLVEQSKSENRLQVKARDQQALATANEQANLTLLSKLKATYRTLQQRYNTLGTAINAAELGLYVTPMVKRIVSNQSQIIQLAEKNPALIAIGYQSEIQFAEKAESLAGYVAGLIISIGDVNQMRVSDRKMLFDYVLSELSNIQELSGNMVNMMQYSTLSALLKAANPFQNFIDADKQLAGDIIQNAKYLKR